MDNIASEWKTLGIVLKFENAYLSAIEKSRHFQPNDCCLEMLGKWLEGNTREHGEPVTWRTLLLAICKVEAWCSSSKVEEVWRALSDEGSNLLTLNRKSHCACISMFFANNSQ